MAGRIRLRALAMLIGLALLAALSAVPARAIEPYPGETQEAFAARARLDQQSKLAAADEAAGGGAFKGMGGSDASSSLGGPLKVGMISLVMLAVGGLRLSRGLFRASQSIAKAGGAGRSAESFEDRLAERLRELDRASPQPIAVEPPPVATPQPALPRLLATGPRTFGRRAS